MDESRSFPHVHLGAERSKLPDMITKLTHRDEVQRPVFYCH